MRVTEGLSDPMLVEILTSNSFSTMKWLASHKIPWILAYGRQAFEDDGKMKFWGGLILEAVGAGKGLSDSQFSALDKLGVEVMYDSRAVSLEMDQKFRVKGVKVRRSKEMIEINASAVVLASGLGCRRTVVWPLEWMSFSSMGFQFAKFWRPKYCRFISKTFLSLWDFSKYFRGKVFG